MQAQSPKLFNFDSMSSKYFECSGVEEASQEVQVEVAPPSTKPSKRATGKRAAPEPLEGVCFVITFETKLLAYCTKIIDVQEFT